MLELIPFLIPPTLSNNVNTAISAVKITSKNGYELLRHILRLFIPGFDRTILANIPSWTDNTDIFDFSKDFILYFRLQRLVANTYNEFNKSLMFLHAINGSEYIESVGALITSVENQVYTPFQPDGDLPPHLQIHGLAQRLSSITQR